MGTSSSLSNDLAICSACSLNLKLSLNSPADLVFFFLEQEPQASLFHSEVESECRDKM